MSLTIVIEMHGVFFYSLLENFSESHQWEYLLVSWNSCNKIIVFKVLAEQILYPHTAVFSLTFEERFLKKYGKLYLFI